MSEVVVLGSINMDVSTYMERIPAPGETVLAHDLLRSPGGKGGNQAVAAARAGGARTAFVGAVGTDAEADVLRAQLTGEGIDVSGLATIEGPSGIALIFVDDGGENSIVVVPGANGAFTELSQVQAAQLRGAAVVLAQLEIQMGLIEQAAQIARDAGGMFMLNAAPSRPLDDALLAMIDVLVVNEYEALEVAERDDLDEALAALAARVKVVVLTKGAQGSFIVREGHETIHVPARSVAAVDTTAAGDTYCGVFAAALAVGQGLEAAAQAATAASAVTVTRRGAQDSIPRQDEIGG